MEYKKILVPIDGSEMSTQALLQAVYVAQHCGASLGVLHVVDLNKEVSAFERVSLSGYVPSELKETAYQLLAEIMHEIPREIEAKALVKMGDPGEVIVDTCMEGDYDLIIMGSRGFGTFRQMVMGSVSQSVLHHAPCSVLIAR